VAIRIVRAAVLTGFLAVVFLVLVVVGSANAADDTTPPPAVGSQVQVRLVGGVTLVAVQTDTAQVPAQNLESVQQKTGPAAASTARTIDIIVVAGLVGLALFVWARNKSTRKGH
jgi:uncharacterized membrane protein